MMEPDLTTEACLREIERELIAREPIFHHPELGTDRAAYEQMTTEDFWEVGASGRRYSRQYVIDTLVERYAAPFEDVWAIEGSHCREIAPDVYLLTYTLLQDDVRRTRRSTLWRRAPDNDWQIAYHQGTIVEDDGPADPNTDVAGTIRSGA